MPGSANAKPTNRYTTLLSKLSARKQAREKRWGRHDRESPEARKAQIADWTTISKAFVESCGLSVVSDLTSSSFLAEGDLSEERPTPGTNDTPMNWLVVASSSKDADLPRDLKTELDTHGAGGFIWISTVKRRATLQRRVQRLPETTRGLPHALYGLGDVDRSVNLGPIAGKLYTENYRTQHSFEQIFDETLGAAASLGCMYIAIALAVAIEWREGGIWVGIAKGFGLFMLIGVLMWMVIGTSEFLRRFGRAMILLLVLPVSIVWIAGSYNWVRDLLIAVTLGIAAYLVGRPKGIAGLLNPVQGTKHSLTNQARVLWFSIWLATTWVSISIADRFLSSGWSPQHTVAADPERFGALLERTTATWGSPAARVDVALSGGGYRAAIFHAGVLEALEDVALRVDTIATISGGSIVGSFYAVGGMPRDFAAAVERGRFNLKRDLLNIWELANVACPGKLLDIEFLFFCDPYGRSDIQAALLDRVLLGGQTMAELPDKAGTKAPPQLIIGAVDLRTGDELGFTRDRLLRISQARPRDNITEGTLPSHSSEIDSQPIGHLAALRVAELVAGSGAFPGALNSVVIGNEPEPDAKRELFNIADGGLGDNFGLSLLLANEKRHKRLIVVSDGSMPLGNVDRVSAFSEFPRAMDVVYASSGVVNSMNIEEPPSVLRLSPFLLNELASYDTTTPRDAEKRLAHLFQAAPKDFLQQRNVHSIDDLRRDIRRATKTFIDVSTLQDQFAVGPLAKVQRIWTTPDASVYHGTERVWALFALGKYLVYLECPRIAGKLGLPRDTGCMSSALTASGIE